MKGGPIRDEGEGAIGKPRGEIQKAPGRSLLGRFRYPSRRQIVRRTASAAAAVVAFLFVVWLGEAGLYNLSFAEEIVPALERGFSGTMWLVGFVIPVGFGTGLMMASARTSDSRIARAIGGTYVEFFRSMPPFTLIAFSSLLATKLLRTVFYIDNPVGLAVAAATFALALHSGSYQTEILRAGILSVPAGQVEAAYALGLTRSRTLFNVILPQAFRISLPALGNEFSSVIKDTSLLSAISAVELAFIGGVLVNNALSRDFNLPFIIWSEISVLYFVLTYAVVWIVRYAENRSKVPGLEAAQL
jgi:ABC-type amino acid transport system permease subunit